LQPSPPALQHECKMWTLNPTGRAQHVQNSRKKSYYGSEKFHPTTRTGGPLGGSRLRDPLP
jgi:hypothetical protein